MAELKNRSRETPAKSKGKKPVKGKSEAATEPLRGEAPLRAEAPVKTGTPSTKAGADGQSVREKSGSSKANSPRKANNPRKASKKAAASKPAGKSESPTPQETAKAETKAQAPDRQAASAAATKEPPKEARQEPQKDQQAPKDTSVPGAPGTGGNAPHLPQIASDPEAFARNMARAFEEGGKALAAYLRPREEGSAGPEMLAAQTAEVMKTIGHIGEYWMADPTRTLEAQTRLWGQYLTIWNNALRRTVDDTPQEAPDTPADKRFSDPEWSQNPMFDALKQLYLATSRWADELVDKAEGIDPHTKAKASFYVKQISNAFAPTNFAATNPAVLRATAESNAENLARGMHMLAEDIEAGHGTLRLRQTKNAFTVGENLATTPGKVIAQNDICQIIQYEATTEKVLKRPLLIVPPWINKYYILDLNEEKSFIRWAVAQGHSVFVISWINPDERHASKGFDAYMQEGIFFGLDVIKKATGEEEVNAIGYCVGGTLLAVALAFLAQSRKKPPIASATFFAAQVDFTYAGDLKLFADEEQIETLEEDMARRGYLEGSKMATAFNLLRSNDLIWPYVINNYMAGKEPMPFDLLYWNSDATRMPAANHSYYLRNCYLENNLTGGRMKLAGKTLDLGRVMTPVYNLATREDHIAPAKSVFHGSQYFGGPVRFVLSGSGHIAGVVNPPSRGKYQYWTGKDARGDLDAWIGEAEEHKGSWWPDWQSWIETLDDRRVKKRAVGGGRLNALEDAPGSYVRMKS
ncbi:class I poly(R)-hydroxyalkanoic acid synthase [Afifella sp. IM 167]|nr:class I poly(R)-hydroxyalkanoic acid synthase [Afifella sp. IM 167]